MLLRKLASKLVLEVTVGVIVVEEDTMTVGRMLPNPRKMLTTEQLVVPGKQILLM
jgi:hypothetical protein